MKWDKLSLFAGGVLFGTAGVKLLSSKDAKKVYTQTTAAALRAKECVMTTVTHVKENVDDILSDSKEINQRRAQADSFLIEDEFDPDIEDEFYTDPDTDPDINANTDPNGVPNDGANADCQKGRKNEKNEK